jgi:hypothetical protein
MCFCHHCFGHSIVRHPGQRAGDAQHTTIGYRQRRRCQREAERSNRAAHSRNGDESWLSVLWVLVRIPHAIGDRISTSVRRDS